MSPWSIVAVAGAPLAVLIVPLVRLVCTRASMPPAPGQPPRSPGPRAIYPGGVTSHVRPRLATLGFGAALAALVLMTAGLLFSGAVAPTGVLDPGAVVRWGVPVVTVLTDAATAVTLGALALCAVVLPWARSEEHTSELQSRGHL